MKLLPQFVRDLLSAPPRRGQGLNLWLFRVARVLWPYRAESEIVDALRAAIAGEPVKLGEIERAVSRSRVHAWNPDVPDLAPRPSAWPSLDRVARERAIGTGLGFADLVEASPVSFDSDGAEEIADRIFPGNPLLCVAKSNHEFATRRREIWRGRLGEMALIVPSPMSARRGYTQDGKESEHTLENTGPRRFLVVEQDIGTQDEQAAVMLHLAASAPLAMAVHSGGKSIHGWFFSAGTPEPKLRRFMAYAVALGADRATWTRSQFVRCPGGLRDNGKRQEILFFNPDTIK